MKSNQTLAIGTRDQEEWKGQLRPSYRELWAPNKPTTRKSIMQTRRSSPKFVTLRKDKNQR